MNIKQQKQIKLFLIEEFGTNKGNSLFEKQGKMLNTHLLRIQKISRKIR